MLAATPAEWGFGIAFAAAVTLAAVPFIYAEQWRAAGVDVGDRKFGLWLAAAMMGVGAALALVAMLKESVA